MSVKKPEPIVSTPVRRRCPVCGAASYSRTGTHPQCAMAKADALLKAAQRLQRDEAPKPARGRPRGFQRCLRCGRALAAANAACQCAGGAAGAPPTNSPGSDAMSAKGPDHSITQQVNQKLVSRGFRSPCHVGVDTRNGEVTLSGSVQFAHQKSAAVRLAGGIRGVRRVVDRIAVNPAARR